MISLLLAKVECEVEHNLVDGCDVTIVLNGENRNSIEK
jgi:hypothetical protein